MLPTPASQDAGSFALPAGIVAFNEKVTYTAYVEGLENISFPDVTEARYFYVAYLTLGSDIGFHTPWEYRWDDVSRSYHGCKQVHVIRARHAHDHDTLNQMAAAYERNPWNKHEWFRENMLRWVELMPAPSETKPGYLAYYQTPAKRARDLRTPIKAGRWLNKFFGDILSQEEIQKYGLEWEAAFGPVDVKITQDSDEIQAVYQAAHLGSCMWFPEDDYEGSCHPARVYGGNLDLGIAYIGTRDTPLGRCLVWPAKRIYYDKMYGDDFRLRGALEQAGYSEGDSDEFEGARLLRIPSKGRFVLPYIDTHDKVRDNGDYLILDSDGSIGCQSSDHTEGLSVPSYEEAADTPDTTCYRCDADIWDADNSTYVDGHGDCCPRCISNHHFLCEISDNYHRDSERADTQDHWSVAISSVRHNSDWFRCPVTDKWYPTSEHEEVTLFEGGTCVDDHASSHGFYCECSEQWSLENDKAIKLSNGTFVHLDSFENREQFETYLADNSVSVVFDDLNQIQLQFGEAA